MKDLELYGVDLPVTVRSIFGVQQMALHVPGWVNVGVLRARAVQLVKPNRKQRRARR